MHGEQVFDVEPLALPIDPREVSPAEIADAPAVRLFVDRARAADSRFALTARTPTTSPASAARSTACRCAIELAAACIRLLTPPRCSRSSIACSPRSTLPIATSPSVSARSEHGRIEPRPPRPLREALVRAARCLRRGLRLRRRRCRRLATSSGPSTCPARSSSSSTAASSASTSSPATVLLDAGPGARARRRSIRARPGCRGRAPRACHATTCASPPTSSRCCAERRNRPRSTGSRPSGRTSAPATAISSPWARSTRSPTPCGDCACTRGSATSSLRRRPGPTSCSRAAYRSRIARGRSRSRSRHGSRLAIPGTEVDREPLEEAARCSTPPTTYSVSVRR